MNKVKLLIIFLLLSNIGIYAYTYLPNLTCYNKQDYQAGRQNWDIDIDDNGIVYFANSNGLLYNVYGEWGLKTLSKKGVVRAVLAAKDTIWCGGGEYGYFSKVNDDLQYHYLGMMNGGQIWNIESFGDLIIFQAENKIAYYNKVTQTQSIKEFPESIWSTVEWNGKIWLVLRNGQIGYLDGEEFFHETTFEQLSNQEVRKLFVHQKYMYMVLYEGDIFRYDGNKIEKVTPPRGLSGNSLFTGMNYDDSSYCLGTVSDGFLNIADNGEVLKWVNTANGLIDNTILAMKKDQLGNVWLGLDYGIAMVELQSAINPIFDGGATYDIKNFQGKTYLATNKGLFYSTENEGFKIAENSVGQIWNLKEINQELYICHNRGLLRLQDDQVLPVVNYGGVVDIAQFDDTGYFLFSTYHGLILTKKEGTRFNYIKNLNIWGNPRLHFDKTNNCIWAQIENVNILKLTLNPNNTVKNETFVDKARVFDTSNGFYFYGNNGLWQYSNDKFIKSNHPLTKIAENSSIEAMDFSADGNTLAYIQNNELKLEVLLPDGNTHSYNALLKSLSQNIMPGDGFIDIHEGLLRLATDRGVTIFDINSRSSFLKSSPPVISSVTILNKNNTQLFYPFSAEGIELSSGRKDLNFKFSINKLMHDVVEYRYRLFPMENKWSAWSTLKNEVLYPQVKGGQYTIYLQSRVNGGTPEETSLTINIDKLWYQTMWVAIPITLAVLLLVFGMFYFMSRINNLKLKKQQQLFKQREDQKSLSMRNEQLLQYTEIISHKNEFLNKVKSGLEAMRNSEAQRWANMINDEVNNEKKEFLFHKLFSEIHQDFIARLSEKYPSLTSNDIRILSFIRTNLDKKEVCNLMNISSRSLDTSRSRIKKKLNLDTAIDLNQFIRDF
ncbi:hypothetical protein E9993_16050 [Labilibacter sediminis]|nr:hypothetical protein E9993_16050 [Labilibacter sediminis]